ncbi:hypothetical protein [Aminobacter sp. HY435]|uniref:hypothetical protein n=1 Tax=Aminobacter sp. HY435 TaxID=2970917 RepID=UPI0022B9ADA0|nr:hypothetical protein [Aminobacter sp. HY435]
MNFRRGFWRLWIVVSLFWVGLLVMEQQKGPTALWFEMADGWEARREIASGGGVQPYDPKNPDAYYKGLEEADRLVKRIWRGNDARNALTAMVMLPTILLVVGVIVGWVAKGFRRV